MVATICFYHYFLRQNGSLAETGKQKKKETGICEKSCEQKKKQDGMPSWFFSKTNYRLCRVCFCVKTEYFCTTGDDETVNVKNRTYDHGIYAINYIFFRSAYCINM